MRTKRKDKLTLAYKQLKHGSFLLKRRLRYCHSQHLGRISDHNKCFSILWLLEIFQNGN